MAESSAEVAPEAGAHETGAEVDTESPQIQLADEQDEDRDGDEVKEDKLIRNQRNTLSSCVQVLRALGHLMIYDDMRISS
jgi:hypothetical protein